MSSEIPSITPKGPPPPPHTWKRAYPTPPSPLPTGELTNENGTLHSVKKRESSDGDLTKSVQAPITQASTATPTKTTGDYSVKTQRSSRVAQFFSRLFMNKATAEKRIQQLIQNLSKQAKAEPVMETPTREKTFGSEEEAIAFLKDPKVPVGSYVLVKGMRTKVREDTSKNTTTFDSESNSFVETPPIKTDVEATVGIVMKMPEKDKIVVKETKSILDTLNALDDLDRMLKIGKAAVYEAPTAERLLSGGNLAALSFLVDKHPSKSADRQGAKEQLQLAESAKDPAKAALHLLSALGKMKDLDPKIANIEDLYGTAQLALIQALPEDRSAADNIDMVQAAFVGRFDEKRRSPQELHLMAALALRYCPASENSKQFFRTIDQYLMKPVPNEDTLISKLVTEIIAGSPIAKTSSQNGPRSSISQVTSNPAEGIKPYLGNYVAAKMPRETKAKQFIGLSPESATDSVYASWGKFPRAQACAAYLDSLGYSFQDFADFLRKENLIEKTHNYTYTELGVFLADLKVVADFLKSVPPPPRKDPEEG